MFVIGLALRLDVPPLHAGLEATGTCHRYALRIGCGSTRAAEVEGAFDLGFALRELGIHR